MLACRLAHTSVQPGTPSFAATGGFAVLVTANQYRDAFGVYHRSLFVLIGTGGGAFARHADIARTVDANDLAVGDLNRDGPADIALPHIAHTLFRL